MLGGSGGFFALRIAAVQPTDFTGHLVIALVIGIAPAVLHAQQVFVILNGINLGINPGHAQEDQVPQEPESTEATYLLSDKGKSELESYRELYKERRWTRGLAVAAIIISVIALVLSLLIH